MAPSKRTHLSRRAFLRLAAALPAPLLLAACGSPSATPTPGVAATQPPSTTPAGAATPTAEATTAPAATNAAVPATGTTAPTPTEALALAPTPACGDDDDVTPAQTAGPFFTPNSPERRSLLEAGLAGVPLALSGHVLTTGCQPVAGALLDFWQADDGGVYDNAGYTLRGHQFSDEHGRYSLETIVPGLYPGRTRHIHVNVQAPNQPILTTQLYFPDEPANNRDGIYRPELLVSVEQATNGQKAAFNFVLSIG